MSQVVGRQVPQWLREQHAGAPASNEARAAGRGRSPKALVNPFDGLLEGGGHGSIFNGAFLDPWPACRDALLRNSKTWSGVHTGYEPPAGDFLECFSRSLTTGRVARPLTPACPS